MCRNNLLLFLLLAASVTSFSQQKRDGLQTYTQTEIDLKLQLLEQKIGTLTSTVNDHKTYLNENIASQEERIAHECNKYSDHISLWSGWMTSISVVAAIILALMGWFIIWKYRDISKEVKEELQVVKDIQKQAEQAKQEAQESKAEIDRLREEIESVKEQAKLCLVQLETKSERAAELVKKIEENASSKNTENNNTEISEYVEETNKTKPEALLTPDDWFLKGYNAQINNEYEDACFYYKKVIELKPGSPNVYNNWGNALSGLAKLNSDEGLYHESFLKYQKAIELKPNDSGTYNNWGNTLSDLAKLNSDEGLYHESFIKYQKAVELNSDDSGAYYNWGNALSGLAKLNSDEGLYHESFLKYQKAIELKPDDSGTYNNWGNTLSDLAKLNSDEGLYHESFLKYQKAVKLKPDSSNAYNNWGTALSGLAKLNSDEGLYHESFLKYQKAVELNPDSSEIYNNWGSALCDYTILTDTLSENKKAIEDILIKGNSLDQRMCLYNLACLYSLLSEKDKALEWLEKELQLNPQKNLRKDIEADPDFDNIKSDPDFVALLDKYIPNKNVE